MTDQKTARTHTGATPLGVLLLLAAVLIVAAGWTWTAWSAPSTILLPVLLTGGASIILLVAFGVVMYYQSARAARATDRADRITADAQRLVGEALPTVVQRVRSGASAATALDGVNETVDSVHRTVLETVATEIARSERQRAAAMAACATAAGRVQAITTAMAADLREMQQRYGNDTPAGDILGDLMHLDHSTAQAGRVADSIAVLTGARSGRRWTRPIPMESILRGAMARIGDYKRVRCHSTSTLAVIGYAAEGVIHALAELLDNAAKFSPPSSTVHVYVEEVQAGVTITVEDSGLVMSEEALRRAREAVSNGGDLTNLSGSRLGLAVVGAPRRSPPRPVHRQPRPNGSRAPQPRRPPPPAGPQPPNPLRRPPSATPAASRYAAAVKPSPQPSGDSRPRSRPPAARRPRRQRASERSVPRYARRPLTGLRRTNPDGSRQA